MQSVRGRIRAGGINTGPVLFAVVLVLISLASVYWFYRQHPSTPVGPEIRTLQAAEYDSLDQLQMMARTLLEERLHLVLRRERKVLRHLALVPGKTGPKLRAAKPDATEDQGPHVRGRIAHNHISMARLASLLSRFERQTIVDLTGLSGLFEVILEWAPDNNLPTGDPAGPPSDRPGLFAAVQEQLGLKLEPRRGPLDVFVVERALKVPEEN